MARKYQKKYLKPDWMNTEGHWLVGTKWPVTGSTGNQYEVEFTDKGFECDCRGFGWHGYCKHSRGVVNKLKIAWG